MEQKDVNAFSDFAIAQGLSVGEFCILGLVKGLQAKEDILGGLDPWGRGRLLFLDFHVLNRFVVAL